MLLIFLKMLCLCSYCRPNVNGAQFHLTIWSKSFNPQQHGGFLLLFNLTADRFEYVSFVSLAHGSRKSAYS